jgi:hypothetical protein
MLNVSLGCTHHPDDVHKILQLEDSLATSEHSLASEKQQVKDLKLLVEDFENESSENNIRLESQKERNRKLKTAHTHLTGPSHRNATAHGQRQTAEPEPDSDHQEGYFASPSH